MRELLYKVFVEDLLIKLVSLLAAVILAFVVRTELEASATLYVRVNYSEPRGRLMVSEQKVDQVKVVVRGPWGRISRVGDTPLEPIQLDLANYSDGELRFTPEMVRLPAGLRIEGFTPSGLYLHYEPEVTVTLPVQLTIEGQPPDGYRIRSSSVSPRTVRLRGAQYVLVNQSNVLTKPLNVANFRDTVSVPVDLAPPPKHAWFADEQAPKVTAEVVVELFEKRFANVAIRTSGQPQNVRLEPATAQVVLRGQGLDRMQEPPQLFLDTSAEERKPAGTTYRKQVQVVNLPPGIGSEVWPVDISFTVLKSEKPEPGEKAQRGKPPQGSTQPAP